MKTNMTVFTNVITFLMLDFIKPAVCQEFFKGLKGKVFVKCIQIKKPFITGSIQLFRKIHKQPSCMWMLFHERLCANAGPAQLQSQIICILPTAQGVMSVKLNPSVQGFYE